MAGAAARQAPVTARLTAARAAGFLFEAGKHTGTRPIHRTHLLRVLSWQQDKPDQSQMLIIRLLLGAWRALVYPDACATLHNLYFVLQGAKMRIICPSAQFVNHYCVFFPNLCFMALPSLLRQKAWVGEQPGNFQHTKALETPLLSTKANWEIKEQQKKDFMWSTWTERAQVGFLFPYYQYFNACFSLSVAEQ